MGVSENSGTPKSSILIGFSIINHPFWGTFIFGNTHMNLGSTDPWIYTAFGLFFSPPGVLGDLVDCSVTPPGHGIQIFSCLSIACGVAGCLVARGRWWIVVERSSAKCHGWVPWNPNGENSPCESRDFADGILLWGWDFGTLNPIRSGGDWIFRGSIFDPWNFFGDNDGWNLENGEQKLRMWVGMDFQGWPSETWFCRHDLPFKMRPFYYIEKWVFNSFCRSCRWGSSSI